MDPLGPPPEDIAVKFGLRPCGVPYTRDHEHMPLAKGVILRVR